MQQMDQNKTLTLLRKYKIPIAKSVIAGSKKEAVHAKVTFPLVLKCSSKEIVHKTDVGGVRTNIRSRTELAHALFDMQKKIHSRFPDVKIDYMLQEQIKGKEIIIGMKRDAQFGPAILFGLGGVFVEVFKDVSFRVAPLTNKDVNEMVMEIKASKLLKAYRGEPAVNIPALKDILKKISSLSIHEKHIGEIDFNPVIVNEKRAVVVDARVMLDA